MNAKRKRPAILAGERKLYVAFGLSLALLIVLGVVLYQTMLRLTATDRGVDRIEAGLAKVDAISWQLRDAEDAQRGYLITGDDRYLAPYRMALHTIDQDLRDLRTLTADNPTQLQKTNNLQPLVTARFAEIAQTIELRRERGFDPAAQVIRSQGGKRIMDQIEQLIGDMQNEQKLLSQQENDELDAQTGATDISIAFGSLLAIILSAFIITRDLSDRRGAYQLLERRVEERTHEIERRRKVAEGLRDIMTILNSNRPLDETLSSIIEQARRLLGSDAGAVYRLEESEGLLCAQVADGLGDVAIDIPISWAPVQAAVLDHKMVVVSNTRLVLAADCDAANREQYMYLAALLCRYNALLVVPLLIKDAIYGIITLYNCSPREFTREEMELAIVFGDQAALAIENARLRTQAEQMAVAAERSRLARDLHDAVTQTLFSTSLIADVLPRLWERDQNEARRRLEELRLLTRGALAEMRGLLMELRPAALVEVGLAELLRQLTEATIGRVRVPITLTVNGQCNLPPDVQIALYRIAQEALNNVARHANAAHITVSLSSLFGSTELQISDDGQGFDPSKVALEHLGLSIMRERAEALGAALRIESQPGMGTQITIGWPGVHAERCLG